MNRERLAAVLVILPLVVGAALVAWYARVATPGHAESGVVVINLTGIGAAGVWTTEPVRGANYWWRRFEPATIHLEVGDEVVLNLSSADLFHCFYIPAFGIEPTDVLPGHTATIRFTADRAGVFQYYCTSMCGGCHFYMRGWLVVTPPGQTPVEPPAITCPLCLPDLGPRPDGDDPVDLGAYLYLEKGCVTCHGFEARGGVDNPNSANSPVPPHHTTAAKLFLASPEDTEAFIALLAGPEDLDDLAQAPDIDRFVIVHARYDNARTIIRGGRYSSRVDPGGPEPPLQMPAWQYLLDDDEIDALLAYFLSLAEWEEM